MPEKMDDEFDKTSKSQRKRDMDALKELGAKLLDVPDEQLEKLSEPKLVEAVQTCKRINRGSARKRQVQYIGKLLRDPSLATEAQEIVDRLDARSQVHVRAFHQLERWRERLLEEDAHVMDEIVAACPHTDRQYLRQLTRKAINERQREVTPPAQYRKLFQYLKQLAGDD